jgi:hypothetical protein
MRISYSVCLSIGISIIPRIAAYAADNLGDLDVTIQVIDTKQSVNEFINRIELPKGVVETTPPANQRSEAIDKSPKTRLQTENTPASRRGSSRARDDHHNNIDSDADKNGQFDSQNELHESDSSPSMDNPRRDATETQDRASFARDQRDAVTRPSPNDDSPNNWDKFHDAYPSSTWPERQK